MISLRKDPVGLCKTIGPGFILKFLLRRLTIREAEEKFSQLLGFKGVAVKCIYPEIGMDVDKPSDLDLVEQVLLGSNVNGEAFMSQVSAVVLAAGQGKRMRSVHPKVLHKVGGNQCCCMLMDAARKAGVEEQIVVIGHGRETLLESLPELNYVVQEQQLGTGHAVFQAREAVGKVLRGFWSCAVIHLY